MDRTDEQGCFGVQEKSAGACFSENPPCNENGRKRGYIDVMKELWDDIYGVQEFTIEEPKPTG